MYSRRGFLKGLTVAGALTAKTLLGVNTVSAADTTPGTKKGIFIDITKCNGCRDKEIPDCVKACYDDNHTLYPEPIENIPDYWPQQKHEDWSDKINLRTRWTPFNWIFVQKATAEVNGEPQDLNIVRLCMHCENPQCQKLCPFGVVGKTEEGAVVIDQDLCFGGAKCRDVCPWEVPQRQAGVGVYLDINPKFGGGGVMYKCDLCYHHIQEGRLPRCVAACQDQGMFFGDREDMIALAEKRAKEINGYTYGIKENGGTSVFYASPAKFEDITAYINDNQPEPPVPPLPDMKTPIQNSLTTLEGYTWATLIAPVAGIASAIGLGYKAIKNNEENNKENKED